MGMTWKERFNVFVFIDPSGCHIWTGAVSDTGYGSFGRDGTTYQAHRLVFDEIPDGMHVHHTCGVRTCVNAVHLVLLTQRDHNALHTAERTHCGNGHEWNEKNTYMRPDRGGVRQCRGCQREADQRRTPRRRNES